MIRFKEFITEQIQILPKDEFFENPYNNREMLHRKDIGGNDVVFSANKEKFDPNHHFLDFTVNRAFTKSLSKPTAGSEPAIYDHVRSAVHSYINHFSPKKVSFVAIDPRYHQMYGHFAKQIATKLGGKYQQYESNSGHIYHKVTF